MRTVKKERTSHIQNKHEQWDMTSGHRHLRVILCWKNPCVKSYVPCLSYKEVQQMGFYNNVFINIFRRHFVSSPTLWWSIMQCNKSIVKGFFLLASNIFESGLLTMGVRWLMIDWSAVENLNQFYKFKIKIWSSHVENTGSCKVTWVKQ